MGHYADDINMLFLLKQTREPKQAWYEATKGLCPPGFSPSTPLRYYCKNKLRPRNHNIYKRLYVGHWRYCRLRLNLLNTSRMQKRHLLAPKGWRRVLINFLGDSQIKSKW